MKKIKDFDKFLAKYMLKKKSHFKRLKGGNKIMETKSRYEVIAELEERKRNLIMERESFADKIREKKKEIRNMERELEDEKEELKEFEESVAQRKETIKELIESTDESLKRFANISSTKKK